MAVILKTKAQINNYDVYLKLNFMRERKDIANLLKRILNGDTLHEIFNNDIVANSVKNFLKDNGLLTETQKVSTKGLKFIEQPFFEEEEEGVFSTDIVVVNIRNKDYAFITKMTRKLEEDRRDPSDISLQTLVFNNSFALEDENCIIRSIENKSKKAFMGSTKTVDIELDATNGKYLIDNLKGDLGGEVLSALQSQIKDIVETNVPEYMYSESEKSVWISNINILSDEEIMTGFLNKEVANVKFKAEPYKIRQVNAAISYAYSYAYCLLDGGRFLSTDDLNDIFTNEILSGKNIHDSIKDELLSFKYSLDEFASKLSSEKFQKLDYRLRVVKELLDVDAITSSDKSFASLNSYDEIASFITNKVNPAEVDELYLVMGYAFVNNKKNPNRIVDGLSALKKSYSNITLVDKAPSQDNVNPDILDEVKRMGIKVSHKPAISDFFHDRYFVFKLKNGNYEVYLCSAELGQLFGSDRHIKGSFVKQKIQDVTMKGRNLIEIAVGR